MNFEQVSRMAHQQLGRLKSDLKVIKKNNLLYKDTKRQIEDVSKLCEDVKEQNRKMKLILNSAQTESKLHQERRIGHLEEYIDDNLSTVYPLDGYKCSISYDKNSKNPSASLTLRDKNGRERMPRLSQGKLSRQLISYSASINMCECLGYNKVYIDEAFYASSPENLPKVGQLIKTSIEKGFQVILIAQTDDLYKDIPRREINLYRDLVKNEVRLESIVDI